jgi:hypothetical protein
MTVAERFGANLQAARERTGLSQEEVQIGLMEIGKRGASARNPLESRRCGRSRAGRPTGGTAVEGR